MLLDFIKVKPIRPSQRFPGYPIYPERAIDDSFAYIPSDTPDYQKELIIRRNDLDINNYVNNSYYNAWMLETGKELTRGITEWQ